MLIFQNIEEVEIVCSLFLCMSRDKDLFFFFVPQMYRKPISTYIMLDDIKKWLIQNESFMKMTWNILMNIGCVQGGSE